MFVCFSVQILLIFIVAAGEAFPWMQLLTTNFQPPTLDHLRWTPISFPARLPASSLTIWTPSHSPTPSTHHLRLLTVWTFLPPWNQESTLSSSWTVKTCSHLQEMPKWRVWLSTTLTLQSPIHSGMNSSDLRFVPPCVCLQFISIKCVWTVICRCDFGSQILAASIRYLNNVVNDVG